MIREADPSEIIPIGTARPLAPDEGVQRVDNIDHTTGAPLIIRALVGGVSKPEDKLATLRKYYPDAYQDPTDSSNFIFTNPKTGKPTLYNPEGLDVGDVASIAREGAQGVGATIGATLGATGGAVAGVPGGPPGMTAGAIEGASAGAGLGAMAGDLAFKTASAPFSQNTQTGLQVAKEEGGIGAGAVVGQEAGIALGALGRAAIKGSARGGTAASDVQKTIDTFGTSGATPSLGQATGNRFTDMIEGLLARSPGGSIPFAQKVMDTTDKIDNFVTQRAQALTTKAIEPEIAGRTISGGITDFVGRFQNTAEALYTKLNSLIKPDSQVSVSNTLDTLNKIAGPIEGAKSLGETSLLSNPLLKDVRTALMADANQDGTIPFSVLQQVRSRIGAKLGSTDLVSDIPKAQLKQLYGALSQDMETAAQQAGPDAAKAYSRASTYYKAGIDRIDGILQPLADKATPEAVFKAVESGAKSGPTVITSLRHSLSDDEWKVVTANILDRMGKAPAGAQNDLGDQFNLETFLTNWNKFQDANATDAIFGGQGTLQSDLSKVAKAISVFRQNTRAFANPSGTAGQVAGQGLIMLAGGAAIAGDFRLAGTIALSAVPMYYAAKLMTSPTFVKWLAQSTELDAKGLGSAIGRLGAIAATSDPETRNAIVDYMNVFKGKQAQTAPNNGSANP